MSFMEMEITQKGALYTCECSRCGATLYTHEWADWDHNERRDAMESGILQCHYCSGRANPETFGPMKGKYYAGRMSAPGYLDCTEWEYATSLRVLKRELRSLYVD